VLAPAALVVTVVLLGSALGGACLTGCDEDKAAATTAQDKTTAELREKGKRKEKPYLFAGDGSLKKRWKVREGQSAQEIADDFELTLEELKACNPDVLDIRQLSAGQFLQVDQKYCDGATTAGTGAVVDPGAGTPGEAAAGGAGQAAADAGTN